ncbi:unnamed protein product [Lampetra fluviatilis]
MQAALEGRGVVILRSAAALGLAPQNRPPTLASAEQQRSDLRLLRRTTCSARLRRPQGELLPPGHESSRGPRAAQAIGAHSSSSIISNSISVGAKRWSRVRSDPPTCPAGHAGRGEKLDAQAEQGEGDL